MGDLDASALIGRVIDGRYRIESVLGQGGMGVVFRATQTSMQRPVAMKTLHPQFATSAAFYERFRREAETASRLHHPNIITVFDFGRTTDGLCYYVMECLEGESLRQRVKRDGPLTLRHAAAIIEQVALGVGHAHKHGVVHRDLKPHNIMLSLIDGNEYVKVLDFGLVKALEHDDDEQQLTSTGQVLGTPQFMPPEQAGGEKVDQRSDLYALTGVFYSCLTGHSPFGANSVRKALQAALTQRLAPIGSKRLGAPVPESLDRFCQKGLEAEPSARFQSTDEFIAALRVALADASPDMLDATPQRSADAGKDAGSGSSGQSPRARSVKVVSAVNQPPLGPDAPTPSIPGPAPAPRPSHGGRLGAAAVVVVLVLALGVFALWWSREPTVVVTPAAAPPPPPTAAPPRPARVILSTTPSGAEVLEDGALLGTTPLTVSWPAGARRVLLFRAPNHKDLEKVLKPEADQDLEFALEPLRKPVQPRPVKPPPEPPSNDIPAFD